MDLNFLSSLHIFSSLFLTFTFSSHFQQTKRALTVTKSVRSWGFNEMAKASCIQLNAAQLMVWSQSQALPPWEQNKGKGHPPPQCIHDECLFLAFKIPQTKFSTSGVLLLSLLTHVSVNHGRWSSKKRMWWSSLLSSWHHLKPSCLFLMSFSLRYQSRGERAGCC